MLPRVPTPPRGATFLPLLLLASLPAPPVAAQRVPDRLAEAGTAPLPLGGLRARCVGPTRGGRVTSVAGVAQRPGHFYAGATGGGVWKTTDYGASWTNISDGAFDTPSIGAVRVAPSDPDVVWVGTGSDGLRSNVISGNGVYRSTDAGATWTHVGLAGTRHIGALEVHPGSAEVAFVAAIGDAFVPNGDRGVYRTRDGGRTWDRVLFVSDTTGFADVEFHPADPRIVYAAAWQAQRKPWTIRSGGRQGGIWRSMDGGNTWSKLTECGLPEGLVGKADFAVSPADPTRLYVLIEAPGDAGGVYRSVDGGDSFVQVSSASGPRKRPFYYTNLDADPHDADVLYASATGFYRSTDGGRTWRRRSTPHGDNHDLWIHPEIPGLMVQANDGGANVTRDGGETWSTQSNQPTAELYQIAADDRFPYWLYAGQQDNSTIRVPVLPPGPAPAGPTSWWESVGGCETGPAIPKPGDPATVYANCKGRFSVFSARTGQARQYDVTAANMYGHAPRDLQDRFQRVSPIHVSPHDPGVVYHASQFVYRTRDEGVTWERISPDLTAFATTAKEMQGISGEPITRDITGEEFFSCLYSVAESPVEPGVIWAGSNDGPVHVTRNGGEEWVEVTPPDVGPHGRVQTVAPSPHDAGTAYVCILRYMLGDWEPHAWRTRDFGASWERLTDGTNGVPERCPTRVLREDPEAEGVLYLGTEYGLFVSVDDGASWMSFAGAESGMPRATPITDLQVHRGDLVMSTMGRSFWVVDDLTPVRAWARLTAGGWEPEKQPQLFVPRVAHRMRYRGRRGIPEFPSPGATLDYWLPNGFEGTVDLTITAESGGVVRRLSSAAPQRRSGGDRGPTMRYEDPDELVAAGSDRIPAAPGHNRIRWDMQHAGAWHPSPSRAGRGGPLVVPGVYTASLHVRGEEDDWKMQVAFRIDPDPRVAAEGITREDLRAQEALELEVRDLISRARRLEVRIDEALEAEDLDAARRAGLEDARRDLVTAGGMEYPQPMLLDQLSYLSGVVGRADQRPGRDAVRRAQVLAERLEGLEAIVGTPPQRGTAGGGN